MTNIATTWHHLRRRPFQSMAVISVITLTFIISTLFAYLSMGLTKLLHYVEAKPEITIFFKEGVSDANIQNLIGEIRSLPTVRELRFVSSEEALKIYQEQNKANPLLLEMVTADVLPASLEIAAVNPTELDKMALALKEKKDLVEELIYQKEAIDFLTHWINVVKQAGLVVLSTLALLSLLAVFIVTGFKCSGRKNEVSIMRLIGASSWYVKKPFVLEGTIYGLVGSLTGFLTATSLVLYYREAINANFQSITFISYTQIHYLYILSVSVVIGILIGVFGSLFSVNRQFKF